MKRKRAFTQTLFLEPLEDRCLLSYTPIDLGALGGSGSSVARAINNANQVAGSSSTADGDTHAFYWDDGVMTDLGTLGGSYSNASDINDAGQVVGSAQTFGGTNHAFLWQNGTMTDLGVAAARSEATAISNSGVIVGVTDDIAWASPGSFVWQNGSAIDLISLLPANSGWTGLRPYDVNDHGQIVGSGYLNGSSQSRAFLYRDTDGDGLFATGPGQIVDLLGEYSVARAINDSGQIAGGVLSAKGEFHGFLWTPSQPNGDSGAAKDLGRLPGTYNQWQPANSNAHALNDSGDAVGSSTVEMAWNHHAVVSSGGTRFKDLNSQIPSGSDWDLANASGINNAGWIVGFGAQPGPTVGFLLVPGSFDKPLLFINNVTVSEGNAGTANAVFTVTLSQASAQTVTVEYTTADWHSTGAYLPTSGTLTFAPGETTKTIAVPVIGDTQPEGTAQFLVNLTNPKNAWFARSRGVGTILDDDARLTISDATVIEGNSGVTQIMFTVTLSAPSTETVTVNYTTRDGSATSGSDYVAASGTLTFAPGETTKTITVLVIGDTVKETDEYFEVQLSDALNALITDPLGLGTIANDEKGGRR